MPYGLAAYQLRPQTFDPAGMLQAATNIQSARTQDELRRTQLADARERQEALAAFRNAGGINNPSALRLLSGHPDLLNTTLTSLNARNQMFAMENARSAQRVMALPEGSQERAALYRQELERARSEGRIDDARYQHLLGQPPTNLFLQDLISQAQPLNAGMSQREILRLFGFGDAGTTEQPPNTQAPPPNTQNPLLRLLPPVTETPPPDLERLGRVEDLTGLGPDAGASLLRNPRGLTNMVPNIQGVQDYTGSGRTNTPPPDLLGTGNLEIPPVQPPPPPDNRPWWQRLSAGWRTNLDARMDELRRENADRVGPAGNPGGLLLPIDPRAIAELSRTQTQPPDASAPPPDTGNLVPSALEQSFIGDQTGQTPPPPPAPPPTAQPPSGRTPPGFAGLRGAIANLSHEQRVAAMLHMLKGEYGEVAKIINGARTAEERAEAEARGKARGEAQANLPQALNFGEQIIRNIDEVMNDPYLGYVTGMQTAFNPLSLLPERWQPTTPWGRDTMARLEQLRGQTFLQAFQMLKGGGNITEAEGRKAEQAIARLNDLGQTDAGYMQALQDARREIWELMNIARVRAGQRRVPYQAPGQADAEGWMNMGGGVRIRELGGS
jgi:hypothetical protein